MRVLITGAAGFIGSRISARLLADGVEVIGLDALTTYYDPAIKRRQVARLSTHEAFTFVEADLLSTGWEASLDDVDAVLHHAAEPGVRASWDGFSAYVDRNIHGTQRLLEMVRGRELRRFVFASSSSIYGDALHFPTSEDAPPAPFNPYGVTKLAAEHLCGVYARNWGVPTVALRYFTVYGGGQRPDMAIQRMVQAARHGSTFTLYGDGSQQRDFTHVDDVVDANCAALEADLAPGEAINIAGGGHASVAELLDAVGRAVGSAVPVQRLAAQPGDVQRTGADTTKARDLLGWKPKVQLAAGIDEQVAWATRDASD